VFFRSKCEREREREREREEVMKPKRKRERIERERKKPATRRKTHQRPNRRRSNHLEETGGELRVSDARKGKIEEGEGGSPSRDERNRSSSESEEEGDVSQPSIDPPGCPSNPPDLRDTGDDAGDSLKIETKGDE